jgi:CubicO group peptidase (beta-lactamase class C family)
MIGSITKTFTATTVALLQAEGKLSLEDKVQKWIPEFKLRDPLVAKEVNISDLLSHRVGFGSFQGDFTFYNSNLSKEDIIQKIGLIDPPYSFRTRYGYSNVGYFVVGELIFRITGKSWEQIVKEKLLEPLKMNRTLLLSEDFKTAYNRASAYTLIDDKRTEIPIMSLDNLAPAGSMSSSAKDMAIWLSAQLNNGKIDDTQIISNQAVQAIRRPYTIVGMDTRNVQWTHFSLSGLGLGIKDRRGIIVYSHSGAVPGFSASWMFVPEEDLGIVILTNTDYNLFHSDLESEILDSFLELPYQGYSDRSLKILGQYRAMTKANNDSLRNVVKSDFKPALPLEAYTGKYINGLYGEIEIKLEKNKLNIHFLHHPDLTGKLEHLKNDTYLCTYSDPTYGITEIPFKIENGKVISLILRVSPNLEFTPYSFTKAI